MSREDARTAARWALWRAGDLRYLLHVGQLAALMVFFEASARRFLACIGRRWGKSRLVCVIAVLVVVLRIRWRNGLEPPRWIPKWLRQVVMRSKKPARVVYAAPTAGMVEEFIAPHMHLLASHAPPELRPELKGGNWVWPGGDRIVIKGCEDALKANRLRGTEADLGIVDECRDIPILNYVVRGVIGPQVWETRGRMLLVSSPPESPDHPFVALLTEAEALGASYRAETASAPHITAEMLAEAIADAGGEDSVTWRREGKAEIILDPSQVVVPEWTDALIEAREQPECFLPHVVGDLGYVDLTVIAFGYYDFLAGVDVIEDELVLSHTTSRAIDAAVAAKEVELWGEREVHRRHIDAQPITRADMARPGFGAPNAANDNGEADVEKGEFWSPVRKDEREAAVNALRLRAGTRKLRVHPRCTTIIAHAKYGRWNARRTDYERPDDGGHHYDGLAALVYFNRMLDRATNPYPIVPAGVGLPTHMIRESRLRQTTEKKLATAFRRK